MPCFQGKLPISIDAAYLNRHRRMGCNAMIGLGHPISEEERPIESISRAVKTVCRLNSVENLLLVVVNYTLNRRAGNDMESGSGWHVLFSHLRPFVLPPIVSINSANVRRRGGSSHIVAFRAPAVSAAIKRSRASLRRDGRIGSRGPVIFRYNDLLYPGGVKNSVQVLFAEIRGYGDYGCRRD